MPGSEPAGRIYAHVHAAARYGELGQHAKAHGHVLRARSLSNSFGVPIRGRLGVTTEEDYKSWPETPAQRAQREKERDANLLIREPGTNWTASGAGYAR
jgi:hypothetical protein